jgi:thioredoxin
MEVMSMQVEPVFDATEATFQTEVVERSHDVPVVVDFWAGWCGPCRSLSPVLEKLAAEANGAWTLAKIDVDQNPGLASSFGVQGIPAVKGFVDGKVVADFTGALPEPQVRAWLQKLEPPMDDDTKTALEERLAELLHLVSTTDGDVKETARKDIVELLQTLPPDDPIAAAARKSLSRALF